MFNIKQLIRENIKNLQPYSSARDEFNGVANVFLDANENSLGSPLDNGYNRYPDPYQLAVKQTIAGLKNISVENIFLGNGSDECIDLLYRCFCNPAKDNVVICPPTYGMYEVSGNINDIEIRKVILQKNFQLDLKEISNQVDRNTKIIWICSPNNPTGNSFDQEDICFLLKTFNGLVVIDEAYIDFSADESFLNNLKSYPNLIVLQTLSKAWGLAALRLGMAYASAEIITVLNKVKPPYNISGATQKIVLEALQQSESVKGKIKELVSLRLSLQQDLLEISFIEKIYASDANFLLLKTVDPESIYQYLVTNGIVVRNRNSIILCEGCLRITVGTKQENGLLIKTLINYSKQVS